MAVRATIDELYARHIKPLPPADRLRLLALLANDLAAVEAGEQPRERSLLELEGLGADLWQGVDAQEYVRKLRDEWHHRP
jgi:hypothetical protein